MTIVLADLDACVGQTLAAPVFAPTGRKLMARGRPLDQDDLSTLAGLGIRTVPVVRLSEDEVEERVILADLCGQMRRIEGTEVRFCPGARAEFSCTAPSLVLINSEILGNLNRSGAAVMASLSHLSFAHAGQTIATIRSRPFGARTTQLAAAARALGTEEPPFQVRPFSISTATVIFLDPRDPKTARDQFERPLTKRLKQFGVSSRSFLCLDNFEALEALLRHRLSFRDELVIVASTTAPSTSEDPIGRIILKLGGRIDSSIVPIEPGSLLMVGSVEETVVVCVPACTRSHERSAFDVLAPALLARYPLANVVAELGAGGLLTSQVALLAKAADA